MEGRHLIREGTAEEYQKNPAFFSEMGHDPDPELTLYDPEEHRPEGYGVGNGHRSERLHRMQRVYDRVSVGKQHPCGRETGSDERKGDALDSGRSLFRGRYGNPRDGSPTGSLHAL